MSKTRDLNWWLTFSQMNFSNVLKKTEMRMLNELGLHINRPGQTDGWYADGIRPSDIAAWQRGAIKIVKALKGDLRQDLRGTMTVCEKMDGLTSATWVDTQSDPEQAATALMLRALREAELEQEQIKHCPVCGNLFIQAGKMEKKYCSKHCRTKAVRVRE